TTAVDSFSAAQTIVPRLGAHYDPETGQTTVGFWIPDIAQQGEGDVWLEIHRPLTAPMPNTAVQTVQFQRWRLPLKIQGEFAWGVYDGLQAGTRGQWGDFYWLVYQNEVGEWQTEVDPLAYSIPFGSFAPAELYDMVALQHGREDADHFQKLDIATTENGIPRLGPPANILQLHVGTASAEGTLAGLTRIYRTISHKLKNDEPLTPAEQNYVSYDAIQLMPIEPTIEYEGGPGFWEPIAEEPAAPSQPHEPQDVVTINLHRPDMTNWGYDIITVASPAPNPAVLGSQRPDELLDLIVTLHNFPGQPIKVIFDVVYGHADNQSLPLLNRHYIASPGMYGQNLNYRQPVVRAILLEMQRRKSNYGVDGLRVDGAQDFKYWDADAESLHHDDDYLRLMNDMVQEVAGQVYLPWMIFEDGRPWPRDDWELASTYREVTKLMPNVVQWGPLTFAHNTPFLFTFWLSKWWRIREIAQVGSHWITGCANHDTLRRGTQVPTDARLNTYLGDTLPEIFRKGYDNPAAKLFDYALMPGIPMDFINAAMHAPWSFIRNTDSRWGVKVVSEEARFLDWAVTVAGYQQAFVFPRLKQMGFDGLDDLRHFLRALDKVVGMTDYDLPLMARLLNEMDLAGPVGGFTAVNLKQIARAWMDDLHEYCNVSHYTERVSPEQTSYNQKVRDFRRQRPYLRENFGSADQLDYLHPTDGSVIFCGLRHAPDNSEQILFIANMEGAPRQVVPLELPLVGLGELGEEGWQVALTTPGLPAMAVTRPWTLRDSEGVVFVRSTA
ncbi:MAG: hypothetical protein KDD89_07505, partial [Anaerolineales bacterium]|nr:hypothetical protein [Anaerolineales bacterium]